LSSVGNSNCRWILQTILDESGIGLAWPETWPEQAQLAAAGDWGELEALQDELQRGRRL